MSPENNNKHSRKRARPSEGESRSGLNSAAASSLSSYVDPSRTDNETNSNLAASSLPATSAARDLSSENIRHHLSAARLSSRDEELLRMALASLQQRSAGSGSTGVANQPAAATASAGNPRDFVSNSISSGVLDRAAAAVYASELQSTMLSNHLNLNNLTRTLINAGNAPAVPNLLSRLLNPSQLSGTDAFLPFVSTTVAATPSNQLSAALAGAAAFSEPRISHDLALIQQLQQQRQQQQQQRQLLISATSNTQGRSGSLPQWTAHASVRPRESRDAQPPFADASGLPVEDLPVILCLSDDSLKLSEHQVLLRQQIQVFRATQHDISTHTRGRNKPILINQVGIRCRHCAHLPISKRQRGSAYFPASTIGLYQAAQNMSTTHIQCGLCSEMPESLKTQFANLLGRKNICSGAGRKHWAKRAEILGLFDTPDGIRFHKDIPPRREGDTGEEVQNKDVGEGGGDNADEAE